jgi:D-alanine-D-alanine ligase
MEKHKITVLYDAQADEPGETEEKPEVFVHQQVGESLSKRGHEVRYLAAAKVKALVNELEKDDSDIIFNLCESLAGQAACEPEIAALLALMSKPFTGAGPEGMALGRDKALSKKIFSFHGIKYPKFSTVEYGHGEWSDDLEFPVIVKPLNQDGSVGISEKSVANDIKELMERISFIHTQVGAPALIEEFVEGREIYVGILGNGKAEALPIIEWDFSKISSSLPKIATQQAKWNTESEAFKAPEIFPEDLPQSLVKSIQDAALLAYRALKLRDYGRVDFRLRKKKGVVLEKNSGAKEDRPEEAALWEPYLIEVNPNPYLDPKAEMAMAARKRGLKYPDLLETIIEHALLRTQAKKASAC